MSRAYMAVRNSCWILEERNGDYFCDCPKGSKGKLCKHTLGLLYSNGHLEATSDVRSVRLGQKLKPGRPQKLPMCLATSQPASTQENNQEECHSGGGGSHYSSCGRQGSGRQGPVARQEKE